MNILVAGGAGYIGSHTCVELINAGHNVICADNLLNSKYEAIKRVEQITGKQIKFYKKWGFAKKTMIILFIVMTIFNYTKNSYTVFPKIMQITMM